MSAAHYDRTAAMDAFAARSGAAQAELQAAWLRIDAHVRSLVPAKAKVFEAHHAVEYARGLFFAEVIKGLPADLCERSVMGAYKAG